MLSSRLSSIRSAASDPEAARSVRQHGTHAPSAIRARAYYLPPRRLFVLALSLSPSIHRYVLTFCALPSNDNAISMRRLPDCSSALGRSLSRSNSIISRGASSKAPSKCEEKGRNEGRSQKCTALAAYLFNVAIVGDEGLSLMAAVPRRRALIFTAIPRPQ